MRSSGSSFLLLLLRVALVATWVEATAPEEPLKRGRHPCLGPRSPGFDLPRPRDRDGASIRASTAASGGGSARPHQGEATPPCAQARFHGRCPACGTSRTCLRP